MSNIQRVQTWLKFLVVVAVAAGSAMYGQTATITGQVLDPSGLSIPAVRVEAVNVATNVVATTTATATGNFSLTVYPGVYRVTAEAPGFKRFSRSDLTVTAGSTVRVDPVMEIGAVTQTVEVAGTVLSVDTDTARVATTVENKFVDELPLVVGGRMRNPFDLVQIAAGVSTASSNATSIGGGQTGTWNVSLDGLGIGTNRPLETEEMAYAAPSVEAVTEVTVETSVYKAEFGAAAGGAVSFTSRSGTNELHGTAYNYLRNDALDARDFFEKVKSVYRQNNFGAAGGGPIVLPKIYDGRNKTFFYLNYEGFRNRVGSNDTLMTIPTPEMLDGNFSNWVNNANQRMVIYDPATTRPNPSGSGSIRDPFSNNQIPAARFSPFTSKVLPYVKAAMPKPNRGATPGTYAYINNNYILTSGSIVSPQDKGSIKIDQVFNPSHRAGFFVNISRFREAAGPDGFPGLPVPLYSGTPNKFDNHDWRVTYDWVLSPSMLNHFQLGANDFYKVRETPTRTNDWKSKLCFKGAIDCNQAFPQISFTEQTGWGGSVVAGHSQPSWSVKDDFSYIRNNHTFKFGFTYSYPPSIGIGAQSIAGTATFSYLGTSVPADNTFKSGAGFASFLLGDAYSGGTEDYRDNKEVYPYYGLYAQDDWRVSRRLTLNIGLRFDPSIAPHVEKDWMSDFSPTKANAAVNGFPGALVFAGFGPGRENSRTLSPSWYGGWGPRFGLAYSLNDKTTVRAAFGRSFNRNTVVRDAGHYQGFHMQYSWTSGDLGITPAFNWDTGLPAYSLPFALDPNATLDPTIANNTAAQYYNGRDATRSPENLSWNLTVQRQLTGNTVVEAGYSALIGTHLMAGLLNFNQINPAVWNSYVAKYGAAGARSLFLSQITSSTAQAAGIVAPYANFTNSKVQTVRTVQQALRPFPQYSAITTATRGNGDHSGHSSYHAMTLKMTRRYSNGLTFDVNYVLSKLLSDADSTGTTVSQDHFNRRLEKSIAGFDQTHVVKFNTVYELPIGKGKRMLGSSTIGDLILGGWRLGVIANYASGTPMSVTRNNPLPISNYATRPVITSYTNWRPAIAGESFDPAKDKYLDSKAFPTQPTNFGNSTRTNPKVRTFPFFNENINIAKKFKFTERWSLDYRFEAFNVLNRVEFSSPAANLNGQDFGVITSQRNEPRRMQMGLKLYW